MTAGLFVITLTFATTPAQTARPYRLPEKVKPPHDTLAQRVLRIQRHQSGPTNTPYVHHRRETREAERLTIADMPVLRAPRSD